MIIRILLVLATFGILGSNTALAGKDDPVVLTIQVIDEAGLPIPTAVVRHPQEKERHPVNAETGIWYDEILYLQDGTELVFLPKTQLTFEISAPGYETAFVTVILKKRKNVYPVPLKKLEFQMEDGSFEEPVIQFGRDKPLDK